MWIYLYICCLFLLLYLWKRWKRRPPDYRRLMLMDLINRHQINSIEWHHRNKITKIILTLSSVAMLSRNRNVGLGERNGIIIRHFWSDGKLHNTDTFDIDNLRWESKVLI